MEYAFILLLCSWVLKWQRRRRQRQNRPTGQLWFSRREWRLDQWVVTMMENLKQIFCETVKFLDLWSKIWYWQISGWWLKNVQISHTFSPTISTTIPAYYLWLLFCLQVHISVLFSYIRACTYPLSLLTMILYLMANGASLASNFWLADWSNSNTPSNRNRTLPACGSFHSIASRWDCQLHVTSIYTSL